eukprot:gene15064-16619_t
MVTLTPSREPKDGFLQVSDLPVNFCCFTLQFLAVVFAAICAEAQRGDDKKAEDEYSFNDYDPVEREYPQNFDDDDEIEAESVENAGHPRAPDGFSEEEELEEEEEDHPEEEEKQKPRKACDKDFLIRMRKTCRGLVVYEHRTKLEAALLKQRTDHRATKHEFVHKMKECAANLTRSKQEATNRFNALDTEHRMQKARHEEVTGDFDRLQQQYVRLTKDHQKIIEGHKEDFQKLRDSKMHESKSLQERVKVLFGEKESCLTQKTKYIGFYHSEKTERLRLTDSVLMIKKTLQKEKTRADEAEESLMDYQKKLELAEKKIEGSPYRLATNAQHQDEASKAARVARTSSLLTMPSAKVQGMIIGKPGQEEMDRKREDSIKDQYEVTEPSERDENKMEGMVTTKSHGEVPFQGLARRKLAIGRKRAKERKAAKATEDDASEITKKEEHGSEAGNTKEDYENEAKKNGDVNADNDDRMKYGKGQKKLMKSFIVPRAKADVTAQNKEEGVEETNARKAGKVTRDVIDEDESLPKKIDDETSMLKRQQQLLHRPIPKIDSEASKRETANENEDEENRDGNAVETEKRGTAEEMDQDETVAKEMAEKRKELSDEDKDEKEKDAVEEGNATKSESKDKERNIEEEEEGVNGDENSIMRIRRVEEMIEKMR